MILGTPCGTLDGGVDVWAHCLMPNHVHLVVVPTTADGWAWSSAAAHGAGHDDAPGKVKPMCGRVLEHWADWQTYLLGSPAAVFSAGMHRHEATGRPLGSRSFVEKLQGLPGRTLLPRKRGPKPRDKQKPKRN